VGFQRHELAQGKRVLREPAFALPVIVMLALAIGVNAAAFGAADRLLLRGPTHVRDQAAVARIFLEIKPPARPVRQYGTFGYPMYEMFRDRVTSFADVAAYIGEGQTTLGHGADAQLLNLGGATASFFPLLGVRPRLGRFFSREEDDPVRPARVAVLGYATWQGTFGASPGVIGTTVTLGGEPYTVVGVVPRGFSGSDLRRVDVWVPVSTRGQAMSRDWRTSWEMMSLSVIARLRAGVTLQAATAEAAVVHAQGYGGTNPVLAKGKPGLASLRTDRDGREPMEATVARWLLGLAILVVALAVASVTNLVLARTAHRRRDLAVRASLGADRAAIIRLLVVEGLSVALVGMAAALVVAYGVGGLLRALLPEVDWATPTVDVRMFALAAAVALVAGIALGVLPVFLGDRFDIVSWLKNTGRGDGRRTSRIRAALTATQSALATVLLVAALLFVRSLENLRGLDLGIAPNETMVISLRRANAPADRDEARRETVRRNDFFPRALEALRAIPGVQHAAIAKGLPFRFGFSQKLRVPGWDSLPIANMREHPDVNAVSDDYFETVGTRLLRGRTFSASDHAGSEPVAIVNNSMARRLWPSRDPIGNCLYTGPMLDGVSCARIVGVVADARQLELREEPLMSYYVPFGQERGMNGGTFLVARFCAECGSTAADVRRTLSALDPSILYVDVRSLQSFVDPQMRPWQLGAAMFTLMGALALSMAAFGLYSVVSYLVSRRVREMSIRIALGARAMHLLALVLRGSVGSTIIGVGTGLAVVLAAAPLVEPLLFEVSPKDGGTLLTVAILLPLVAGVAGLAPARRASRVDPARTLRAE
jgi:predicted permease